MWEREEIYSGTVESHLGGICCLEDVGKCESKMLIDVAFFGNNNGGRKKRKSEIGARLMVNLSEVA